MQKIPLALLLFVVSGGAFAQVECRYNGDAYQPFNKATQKFIGKQGFGYSEEEECRSSIKVSKRGVCNWNGSNWSTYHLNGKWMEGQNYVDLSLCLDVLAEEKNDKICGWNGFNWQPYSLLAEAFMGKPGYGLSDRSECLNTIAKSPKQYACNWSGDNSYTLYSSARPNSNALSVTFSKLAVCEDFSGRLANRSLPAPNLASEKVRKPYIGLSNKNVGYTLAQCHDPQNYYHHVLTGQDGKILPECIPDTLYSWGNFEKTFSFYSGYSKSGNWSGKMSRPFYLTPSPLGTFAYGPIPLRIKMKKGINVLYAGRNNLYSCDDLSERDADTSLVVNYWVNEWGSGVDYILCSMGPVESWSFATKEHYDEILRELVWVGNNDYKNYELYFKKNGVDQLWGTNLDGHDYTEENFNIHMSTIQQFIGAGLGGVFAQNPSDREKHFNTRFPIYFNPE